MRPKMPSQHRLFTAQCSALGNPLTLRAPSVPERNHLTEPVLNATLDNEREMPTMVQAERGGIEAERERGRR